jgi:hypothetical protein
LWFQGLIKDYLHRAENLQICTFASVAAVEYSARFNINNINGTITFSQDAADKSVYIRSDILIQANMKISWSIHNKPTPIGGGLSTRCLEQNFGHIACNFTSGYPFDCPKFGHLVPNKVYESNVMTILNHKYRFEDFPPDVDNPLSILGTTIVLRNAYNSNLLACATILPSNQSELRVVTSTFRGSSMRHASVAGELNMLQEKGSNGVPVMPTLLWGKFYSVKGNNYAPQTDSRSLMMISSAKFTKRSDATCNNMQFFEPRPSQVLDDFKCHQEGEQKHCQMGNLMTKNDPLLTGLPPHQHYYASIDAMIPLHSNQLLPSNLTVIGQQLVFEEAMLDPGTQRPRILGCTNLSLQTDRHFLRADFVNGKELCGSITFNQVSSLHATKIDVNLETPGKVSKIYIHSDSLMTTSCDNMNDGNVLNPYNFESHYSGIKGVTTDFYPMGDLSGKFPSIGRMHNKYEDSNLLVRGMKGILGRAIIIEVEQENKTTSICSRIVPGRIVRKISAEAEINSDTVKGSLVMEQWLLKDGSLSDLFISTDFHYTGTKAENISLRINENEAKEQNRSSNNTYSTFNPYNVQLDEVKFP